MTQGALRATGEDAPVNTITSGGITATDWSGGTTGWTLANATYLPIPLKAGAAIEAARDSAYVSFTNEISKGTLTAVNTSKTSTNILNLEMKTPGTHHNHDAVVDVELPLLVTSSNADVGVTHTAGTDGTNPILLEINEASDTSGYTHIDRANDEGVDTILARITTAIASASWSGGTLTATNDYTNKSVTLQAAGASLTSFGNETIQIVNDPLNLLTVTGMSGGAEGVTVKCYIDIPTN